MAVQAEVAAAQEAMQTRVEEAVTETRNKSSGLRDARERNVHFSARVVALNSRVGTLQRQVSRIHTFVPLQNSIACSDRLLQRGPHIDLCMCRQLMVGLCHHSTSEMMAKGVGGC